MDRGGVRQVYKKHPHLSFLISLFFFIIPLSTVLIRDPVLIRLPSPRRFVRPDPDVIAAIFAGVARSAGPPWPLAGWPVQQNSSPMRHA
jgi:hypothetical protein